MHDLTRSRPARISLLLGLLAVLGLATSAVAALVSPAVQSFPTIFADNTGSLTYDGLNFIVDADPISMFDPAFGPPAFFTGGMATIDADVDSSCSLVSGTFTLTGSVDPPNPAEPPVSGTLLSGPILAFGSQDTSPGTASGTDTFDFVVQITGGTMASSYPGGQDLYLRVDAENSDFGGSCAGGFGSSPTKISMFGTPHENGMMTGQGISCTIGWWKNRATKPNGGQAQHFPDPEFGQVVDQAAVLSAGYYPDGTAVLAPLIKKKPSKQEKADRQLSALLLSLAAGELFPDNQKCRLFPGNEIIENTCSDPPVSGATVGGALDAIFTLITDPATREDAKDCADDINNAMGVSDTVHSN